MPATDPLPGTRDRFADELRRRDYVVSMLLHTAHARGFERLAVPLLEHADSFAEDVVGASPWPEWDPRVAFDVAVPEYRSGYATKTGVRRAVLIPEGTVSVARWLAGRVAALGAAALPVKVAYDLPCHRNEPVDTLSATKLREFSQFGLEILGVANTAADAEIIMFVHDALIALGVAPGAIRVRLNDVGLFVRAVEVCGVDPATAVRIKERLDALAECRAGKQPRRAPRLRAELASLVDALGLDAARRAVWDLLADHDTGHVDDRVRQVQTAGLGAGCAVELDRLEDMRTALGAIGVACTVDLAVVRSHEYYTGAAFEVDVVTHGHAHVEVAGGGRYDKLIGHFLPADLPDTVAQAVPSTGFAFGVERLLAVLDEIGAFDRPRPVSTTYRFDAASAEQLVVPRPRSGVAGYLRAHLQADRRIRRVEVWTGDDPSRDAVDAYMEARGIKAVQWC
ncbi:MAG: hypothetical protein HOV68_16855 [Streptomycetaceae bacterium]|nr:hypothetical protein [Streptomycetaceae bacterium]